RSEFVVWVRAVATAILAAVIAKLTLIPPGALAGVPLGVRLLSITVGFACFLLAQRSMFVGVMAGEIMLIGGALLMEH
ncbi:MAG TPA: AzlD domain-containing protein, partial [Xanthobacteraceae bacterium]|nr:AzlD domain-containing protein [Xanthobacteraceae bacterium]